MVAEYWVIGSMFRSFSMNGPLLKGLKKHGCANSLMGDSSLPCLTTGGQPPNCDGNIRRDNGHLGVSLLEEGHQSKLPFETGIIHHFQLSGGPSHIFFIPEHRYGRYGGFLK